LDHKKREKEKVMLKKSDKSPTKSPQKAKVSYLDTVFHAYPKKPSCTG